MTDHDVAATAAPWPQPAATGAPLGAGTLRAEPAHFVVDEIANWSPSGDGEHDVLRVEKRGANTRWIASALARHAGCRPADVGYAGLKDRHAVTTQWFSVHRGNRSIDWSAFTADGARIVSVAAHRRKLRTGALAGNRFEIVVSGARADADALSRRVARVREHGVPNYFGPQRFGRDSGNLALAARLARGERLRRADRAFALSAARAAIFNAVLAARVSAGTWRTPQSGDAVMLTGSASFFHVGEDEDLDAVSARAVSGDLQPTGPLWGRGEPPVSGAVREAEAAVAATRPELVAAIEACRADAARRALRVFAGELEATACDDGVRLCFELPAGSFATAVINEFFDVDQ